MCWAVLAAFCVFSDREQQHHKAIAACLGSDPSPGVAVTSSELLTTLSLRFLTSKVRLLIVSSAKGSTRVE